MEPSRWSTPFFILGADRSGTTLLRSLLCDKFLAVIPPESEFIRDLAPWRHGKPPSPKEVDKLVDRISRHPRYRSWEVSSRLRPIAYPCFTSRTQAFAHYISLPFEQYAAEREVAPWGDKTPSYIDHVELLAELWPECRFVFIERDGRDVFCSIRGLPFGPNTAGAAARVWTRSIDLRRQAEQAYPGRVLTLRYEDLVARTTRTLRDVGAFLGLEQRTAASRSLESRNVDVARASWFPRLRGAVDASSVGRWREGLDALDLADYEATARAHLQMLGYALNADSPPRKFPRTLFQGILEIWLVITHFAELRLGLERGREVRYVLQRKVRRGV